MSNVTVMERQIRVVQFLIFAVLGLSLFFLLAEPLEINHDAAIYTRTGQYILQGKIPYVDYVEINFPLIHYINVPPAFVADMLSVNIIPVFKVMVYMITLWTVGLSWYLMKTFTGSSQALIVNSIPLAIALFTLDEIKYVFYGQREHLFLLLFIPGALLRIMRHQGLEISPRLAFVIGFVAAIGACLKPYFLLIAAAPEIYWLVTRRKFDQALRPEVVGFGLFSALYVLHFLVVPAAMRDTLFNEVIPDTLKGYNAYSRDKSVIGEKITFMEVLTGSKSQQWWALFVIALFIRPIDKRDIWAFCRPLGLMGIAALVMFAAQTKGWDYHLIPARLIGWLIIACVILRDTNPIREAPAAHMGDSPVVRQVFSAQFIGVIVIVLLQSYQAIARFDQKTPISEAHRANPLVQLIKEYTVKGDPVMVLSTSVAPAYPMLQQIDREPANTYLLSHPIAFGLVDYPTSEQVYEHIEDVPPVIQKYLDTLVRDIETRQPKLIIIQARGTCQGCPLNLSVGDYLDRIGFIADYIEPVTEPLDSIGDYDIYKYIGSVPDTAVTPNAVFDGALKLNAWAPGQDVTLRRCDTALLDSWWQLAQEPTDQDYMLTLVLEQNGNGVVDVNGPPGNIHTNLWEMGKIYRDRRRLEIPCDLEPGQYNLLLASFTMDDVYNTRPIVAADGTSLGNYFYLTTLTVE
ncbi:MAG: hypothetical protein JW966_08110 [Anaerolineae bacterium]|nr:hypothetical protein [Anaerolineae bacterium]